MCEIKWKLYVVKVNLNPRTRFVDSGWAHSLFAFLNDGRR